MQNKFNQPTLSPSYNSPDFGKQKTSRDTNEFVVKYSPKKMAINNHPENDIDTSQKKRIRKRKIESSDDCMEFLLPCSKKYSLHPSLIQCNDQVYFINNEIEKQSVLSNYRKKENAGSVIELFSADDISNDDLLVKKIYSHTDGSIELSEGRLFSGESITLVFDFTEMHPHTIAGLNDLLETPAQFEGKNLSPFVKRLIFVNKNMLTSSMEVPGSDLWRRLESMMPQDNALDDKTDMIKKLSVIVQEEVVSNQDLILSIVNDSSLLDNQEISPLSIKKIDFGKFDNEWESTLKGGLCLNDEGKLILNKSILENVSEGDVVILHDAPWENEKFIHVLATIIRENGYYSYGERIVLPDNIQFIKTQTSSHELENLKKRWITSQDGLQSTIDVSSVVLLNKKSFDEILSNTTQIHENHYRSINPITKLLQNCTTLFITSPLTDQQWIYLLREIDEQQMDIKIIVNEKILDSFNDNKNIQYYCYQNEDNALDLFTQSHEIYQITSEDQWSQLWYQTHFISYSKNLFAQEKTPLLEALISGKNVLLYGIENNPFIASLLESLLVHPAYLFIQGKKIRLSEINLTILCCETNKEKIETFSPLWKKRISTIQRVDGENEIHPHLNFLFNCIKKLPPSQHYSTIFPWESRNFKKLLDQQIEIERKQDGASSISSYHQRKALYTLLVKNYRADENTVGYLKACIKKICPDEEDHQANKKMLRQWLLKQPELNQQIVKQNFWSLVRHCPIEAFNLSFEYDEIDEKSLHCLSYYLIGSVPLEEQSELAKKLQVSSHCAANNDQYYDQTIRKCLYDTLFFVGCENRKVNQPIHVLAKGIERKISAILLQNTSEKEAIDAIDKELQRVFKKEVLENDLKYLAREIFRGSTLHSYRQKRRLKKLANHIELHPMIFLQGVTGAGKSYMAREVVSELQKKEQWKTMPSAMVVSLGPETTKEFLYGDEAFVETIDDDQKSEWQPGPIIQWAINPNPPLLVLDEANLANDGVLAPLAGITLDQPQLCINGITYPLSPLHRIILTGNPHGYQGRKMDPHLQEKMMTFYCRPLSQEVLSQSIIEPALSSQLPDEEKKHITTIILFLMEKFTQFMPNDLSPRDLHDILASIHHTLSYYPDTKITKKQIHSLVWDSFEETIATSLSSEKKSPFIALKHWFIGQYSQDDSILQGKKNKFYQFLVKLKCPDSNISIETEQISQLIYYYWLFLEKQMLSSQKKRGLIVEGPAGWGKDIILKTVYKQWQKEHSEKKAIFLNANQYEWLSHIQKIKQAMQEGTKVFISELNILSSSDIEGLFNEVLTSSSHKGFALIATMNPSSFTGRETLSLAFKNRCQYIHLDPLTKEEILHIIRYHFKNYDLCSWFTKRYLLLSKKLQKAKAPIQLTRSDLIKCMEKLNTITTIPAEKIFESHYSLALHSLSLTIEEFEKEIIEDTQENSTLLKRQHEISLWVNKTSHQPIIVKILSKNTSPSWNPKTSTLILPDIDDPEILQYMIDASFNFDEQSFINRDVSSVHDITKQQKRTYKKYFQSDEIKPSDYRLNVITYDHQGKRIIVSCSEGGVTAISPRFSSIQDVQNYEQFQLGHVDLLVNNKTWSALPGISSHDILIALDYKEKKDTPIQIGRGNITGQLVIKLQSTQESSSCAKMLHIFFVIEPDENYFSLPENQHIQIDESICDPVVHLNLDQYVFSQKALFYPSCYELQEIKQESNPLLKLQKLQRWCNEFSCTKNLIGDGFEYVLNLIRFKEGVCRHQAQVFYFLSLYFGIHVRNINNDIHIFVEISVDGQKTWNKIHILGGGNALLIEDQYFTSKFADNNLLQPQCEISRSLKSSKSLVSEILLNKNSTLSQKKEVFKILKEHDPLIFIKRLSDIFRDKNLEFFLKEKILEEIQKIVLSNKMENCIYIPILIQHFDDIFHSELPIISFLFTILDHCKDNVIQTHNKILTSDDEYKKSYFIFHIIGLLYYLNQLFKKKEIKNSDYYELFKKIILLIDNHTIAVLLFEKIIEEDDDSKQKTEIVSLLQNFKKKFKKNITLTTSKDNKQLFFNTKFFPKKIVKPLQSKKTNKKWSYFYSGQPINITRLVEHKRPFLKRTEKINQQAIFLPFNVLFEYLVEDNPLYLLTDFKIPPQYKIIITSSSYQRIEEFQRIIVTNFLKYFLEKTYQNLHIVLLYPVFFENLENKQVTIFGPGCYTSHEHDKNSKIKTYYNFFQNSYHVNMDTLDSIFEKLDYEKIKELVDDPSSIVISRDFIIKCMQEYISTINWPVFMKNFESHMAHHLFFPF